MKKVSWLLSLSLLFLLAACGPATGREAPDRPTGDIAPETEGGDIFPRPTVTAGAATEAYPGSSLRAATPEGYPALPTPLPTQDPYPVVEGTVWILRPVGEQCADPAQTPYADLQEAVAALTAAGVPVRAAETTSLVVCMACGCPTSAHFRAQIDAENLDKALALGWSEEE